MSSYGFEQSFRMKLISIIKSDIVKKLVFIIAFSLCIGLNLYLRLFPAYFPQLEKKAKEIVESKLWNTSVEEVESLYPDYNLYAKKEIVEMLFKEKIKKNSGRR